MFNNENEESYCFESNVVAPDKDFPSTKYDLSEIVQKPELIFSKPELSEKDKYQKHRKNRELLTTSSKYLGMGNDGFVVALGNPEESNTCVKFVWDSLEIYPGNGFELRDLDDEIQTLQRISAQFAEVREVTRSMLNQTNKISASKNKPMLEAALQESARRILVVENCNCFIPEILEVDSFQETEDEGHDDPDPVYYLNEKYSTIVMENVKGKSFQDIILGYPDTQIYIDTIDFLQIEKDLNEALETLHKHGIRHQDLTIRNVMFDIEKKKSVIIDFGRASYVMGDITLEQERMHLNEILAHLKSFLRSPQEKQKSLIEEFKKRAQKLGI